MLEQVDSAEAPAAPNYPDSHIPPWCRLPLAAHHDRYGGCWSLWSGYVQQWGESACRGCDHRDKDCKGD